MIFRATDEQIRAMMALATNASKPMGMGIMHYRPASTFKASDFKVLGGLDYVEGRMVKLWINRSRVDPAETNVWTCPDGEPRADYQSWKSTYPTWEALLTAAGITIEQKASDAK